MPQTVFCWDEDDKLMDGIVRSMNDLGEFVIIAEDAELVASYNKTSSPGRYFNGEDIINTVKLLRRLADRQEIKFVLFNYPTPPPFDAYLAADQLLMGFQNMQQQIIEELIR